MIKPILGECWSFECSEGQVTEIFMSPRYSDALLVAGTLVHELIHAAIGVDKKHGVEFRKAMKLVGLKGKPTATEADDQLREHLKALIEKIGPYPHSRLTPKMKLKKEGTRLKKVACEKCGYTVRVTAKWIEVGLPVCPCGTEMCESESESDE